MMTTTMMVGSGVTHNFPHDIKKLNVFFFSPKQYQFDKIHSIKLKFSKNFNAFKTKEKKIVCCKKEMFISFFFEKLFDN